MKLKIFAVFLVISFLLAAIVVLAQTQAFSCSEFYNPQKSVNFELTPKRISYTGGDNVKFNLKVTSNAELSTSQGQLKAEIYFLDNAGVENLVDEFFLDTKLSLNKGDSFATDFDWNIPANAASGTYITKIFLILDKRFDINSARISPYSPDNSPAIQTFFTVKNPDEDYFLFNNNVILINGVKTLRGPVFLNATSLSFATFVINKGEIKKVNVAIDVFDGNDVSGTILKELTSSGSLNLAKNSDEAFNYLIPRITSGNYLLRFVLSYKDQKIILKIPVIIPYATGKIQYVALEKFPLQSGVKNSVNVCTFLDVSSFEILKSVDAKLQVKILNKDNSVIFDKTVSSIQISQDSGIRVDFTPNSYSNFIKVESQIFDKDGKSLDKVVNTYDLSDFANIPININIDSGKNEFSKDEDITFTVLLKDANGKDLRGKVMVYLADPSGNIISLIDAKDADGKYSDSFKAVKNIGNYEIVARELNHDVKSSKSISVREISFLEANYLYIIAIILVLIFSVIIIFRRRRSYA